jgi:hypothetical protein
MRIISNTIITDIVTMCIDFIDIILGHNYLVCEFPKGLGDEEPDEG